MKMKKLLSLALGVSLSAGMALAAYAETTGTVDYDKLIRSYNKAQTFNDDSKIKEQELETMRAEFVKQLRQSKAAQPNNPVAADQLEKQLQDKMTAKVNETRDWMSAKSRELETEMNGAISSVAQAKKMDVVVAKQFVLYGGVDITNDVLAKLNTPVTK